MPRLVILTALVVGVLAEGRWLGEEAEYPLGCHPMKFNLTFRQTDKAGRACWGQVQTYACYGSCDTFELGTAGGQMTGRQDVCNYEAYEEKTALLTECEEGADPAARVYPYREALACKCRGCDPARTTCTSLTKRGKGGKNAAAARLAEPLTTQRRRKGGHKRCPLGRSHSPAKRSRLLRRLQEWLRQS